MALIDATGQVIVRTTCSTLPEARGIVRSAVEGGLAACGAIQGPVTSIYRWDGEVVETHEYTAELKTTRACLDRLECLITRQHSYELPAILVLPIEAGERRYLGWIDSAGSGAPPRAELGESEPATVVRAGRP